MMVKHNDISYSLSRSNRKTMSIYVEPGGKVIIHAPTDADIDKINRIIDLKRYWIYESMAELDELNRSRAFRTICDGEGFLFMGRTYRLRIGSGLSCPLSLSDGFFNFDDRYIDKAKEHFVKFYREQGMAHIPKRVDLFKKKLGLNPQRVRVMELRNRWASRSITGVNFHWKIMLAPVTVIDYVVVHELVHFLQEGHGPKFWELVESIIPNYQERKNWLRLNGANLDI